MFHVAQWSEDLVDETPSLDSIPLWAHLHGVPFNLIHQQGLSHIAGQLGEPVETDDWTVNLSSISSAHVKVEVNTSGTLPTMLEVERENGSLCTVRVDYPWLPPICSHCKEVGHIIKNCLHLPPATAAPVSANLKQKQPSSTAPPVCYNCKAEGHLMRNCPKPTQQWTPVVGKHKKKTRDESITPDVDLASISKASTVENSEVLLASSASPLPDTTNVPSSAVVGLDSNSDTVTIVENLKGPEETVSVSMDVDPCMSSPLAAYIPLPGDLADTCASPGSPMEGIVDCILGLPADCPSRPVVVNSSCLIPCGSTLNLNPSHFNPFPPSSHLNNSTSLPNTSTLNQKPKVTTYLEITKLKTPFPSLISSPSVTNSFTLITSPPLNKPDNLFEGSLPPLDESHPKSQ